jgi:hypothetical protein
MPRVIRRRRWECILGAMMKLLSNPNSEEKMGERKSLRAPSLNHLQHFGSRDVEGFVSSDIEIT